MSCVSQARARAGQLLFLRRNDLRGRGLAGTWTCGDGSFVSVPLFIPADGTCRDGPFVSVPLFMPADGTCGDGSFVSVPLFMPADGTCGDGPFVSVPLFMPVEKQGDRHKRTVPMSPLCSTPGLVFPAIVPFPDSNWKRYCKRGFALLE